MTGFRKARHTNSARIANSVKCAPLRTRMTTECSASSDMRGKNQRTIGAMMCDECENERRSQDAEKMTAIQTRTGSQYLMNARGFGTRVSFSANFRFELPQAMGQVWQKLFLAGDDIGQFKNARFPARIIDARRERAIAHHQ